MKVTVTLSIDVDIDEWESLYGTRENLRTEVRRYALEQVSGSAAAEEGAITSATVKN